MKVKISISILFLSVFIVGVYASDQVPILVSPGNDVGIALVGEVCPTFSWTAVEGSAAYRVEVFNALDNMQLTYEEIAALSSPVLTKEILGAATSWTPSSDQCLAHDGIYVWYVQAIDAYGAWAWSKGVTFMVDVGLSFASLEETVSKTLEDHGFSKEIIREVVDNVKNDMRKGVQGAESQDSTTPIGIQGLENSDNTFYGLSAGASTTGTSNAFFGSSSGFNNTTGWGNTFLGHNSGNGNTTGFANTFIGRTAGYSSSTASANTFVGSDAGYHNSTGSHNTFLGTQAGNKNTTGYYNTFVGCEVGRYTTTGFRNTFLGTNAGQYNTTGGYNTIIGSIAGANNTTGENNTIIGDSAGSDNTTGGGNTLIGRAAGSKNIDGSLNTFIGSGAGSMHTTGHRNTFLGYRAGYQNTTGLYNVFLGSEAGYNETGSNKLYIDNSDTSDPLIYGEFDSDVLAFMGTVGVGTKTPAFPMEMKKTGTNASIVVDRTDGATNYINATDSFGNFGTVTNHPLRLVVNSQWKVRVNSDLSLTMRNGASCTAAGVWTNASSRDLKENIEELSVAEAEEALAQLEPVSYNYKTDETDKYVGFIAEDVPDLVASKDRKGMSSMDVVAVLTKVLQEQQKTVYELQKVNKSLQKRLEELEQKNKAKEDLL